MSGQAGLIRTNAFEIEGHTSQWSLAWVATYRAWGQAMTTVSAVKGTRMAAKRAADPVGRRRQEEGMR